MAASTPSAATPPPLSQDLQDYLSKLEARVRFLEGALTHAVLVAKERLDCKVCGGDLSICKHPQG